MSHDLLDDRYGRFREIPLALARRGHDVRGICLSYRYRTNHRVIDQDDKTGDTVVWDSVNLGHLVIPGLIRFISRARRAVREFRPDIVWAGSDSFYGPLALLIAHGTQTRVVFDIYDHFETFGSTKIPGVLPLYRWATRRANGVTSFSEATSRLVTTQYGRTRAPLTLVNATRTDLFYPRDKVDCRRQLDLPLDAEIIGTSGALSHTRGISALFAAFQQLAEQDDRIHLAIAGPRERSVEIPTGSRVHDFGMLPHETVPVLINALDIGVICHRHSSAGEYGFPYKAYEMMACHIPLVAADVGAMSELLGDCPECLYEPEDSEDLVRAIRYQLATAFVSKQGIPTWNDTGRILDDYMQDLLAGSQ
jgi:teichuronic acid biosynthesis glycosyltransferase TuaC